MKNVFDYLKFYNETSFDEYKFNDMDNVVFSILSYLPLKNLVTEQSYDLLEILKIIQDNKKTPRGLGLAATKILEIIALGQRYKDVVFSNYVSLVDDQTQFSAVKFKFNDMCYIAFKGTDSSLSGWKENLELCYKYPVNAQEQAISYLQKVVNEEDKNIYIGGHSKGGNLAMVSAMENNQLIDRIITIYNNDGPGFLKKEFESKKYKEMSKKLKNIIPEGSMVGVLLNNIDPMVIESNEIGIQEHFLNNWQCFGGFLIPGNLSKTSARIKKQLNEWVEKTSDQNKKIAVNALFDILYDNDIKYFNQLKDLSMNDFIDMIKDANKVDEDTKNIILETLKSLLFNSKKEE